MSEIKLLPCPFCGGEAELCKGDWIGKEYWVKCTKCICKTSLSNNYNEPIKAWNTRKPLERIIEKINKLPIDPYNEPDNPMVYRQIVIDIVKEVGGIE